jgi:hypothetical protein
VGIWGVAYSIYTVALLEHSRLHEERWSAVAFDMMGMLPNHCQLFWNTTMLFLLRILNAAKYSRSCSDYFQKHSNKACQGLHSSRETPRLRHCLPRQRQRLEQRLRIDQIVSPSDTRFPTRSAMTLLLCASWSMCAANSLIVNTVGFLCLLHSIVALW